MNVLHASATYSPFVGGAETYLRAMSERLAANGNSVTVATTDAGEVETFWNPRRSRVQQLSETLNGVEVHRAQVRHTPFSPLSFYLYRRLAVEISGWPAAYLVLRPAAHLMPWVPGFDSMLCKLPGRFDLVHGVNIALEWPLIAAWRYARQMRLPFVATPFVHTGEPNRPHVVRNYTMPHQLEALRHADAVIVQTEIEGNALAQRGVRPERLHTLGMGIDLAASLGGNSERFCTQYGITEPIVLFMGVLTKDKGALHLIEAMRVLWDRGMQIKLVLAGRAVQEFEDYWKTLPDAIARHIVRTGVVTGQSKLDAFAAADVFTLPSRIDSFGIVILEAWANQLPVIGARAGGIPAVIDEGCDGLLVNYGDIRGLADTIARLLGDEPLRKAMGSAGHDKVSQRYTWDLIYERLIQVYQRALAEHAEVGRA